MAKSKGEAPNQSKNYNRVFKKGDVQEGGSLGYAVASLLRALARKQGKKAATKSEYPKSNVKVVKPKKKAPAKKRQVGPARPTPEQFKQSQREQIKWWEKVESQGKAPGGTRGKKTPAPVKKSISKTSPRVKKSRVKPTPGNKEFYEAIRKHPEKTSAAVKKARPKKKAPAKKQWAKRDEL